MEEKEGEVVDTPIEEWASKYPQWFGLRELPEWIDEFLEYLPSLRTYGEGQEKQKMRMQLLYSIIEADIEEDETINDNTARYRMDLVEMVHRELHLLTMLYNDGKLKILGKEKK